ncbi:MAG TPA: ribosome maturation factor RimP [Candidatus Dormibacteraeota bacterium]|nr:ribosome maturation factor RimP [Candidatus Dormibacteraeota bacterium]
MAENAVELLVRELVGPALALLGIELVDVTWLPGRRTAVLRLTVDKPGGVTIDDCGSVSEAASVVLDLHEEAIPGRYNLEVSSPGAERMLRDEADYRAALGRRVRIHLRQGEQEQVVEGRLVSLAPEALGLESRRIRSGRLVPVSVDRSAITAARVVVDL